MSISGNEFTEWLETTLGGFCEKMGAEVEERQAALLASSLAVEARDVALGLLSRQFDLVRAFASSPTSWNDTLWPLSARPMLEVLMNLRWIAMDLLPRSRLFIDFGLGQLKLEIEHRRNHLSQPGSRIDEEYLTALEQFAAAQRYPFLTTVKLGSWADKDLRNMAQECGMDDDYRLRYSPLSGAVHSQWHSICRFNLKQCSNPLHGLHLVADLEKPRDHPEYLFEAADYMDRTLREVDALTGAHPSVASALDWLDTCFNGVGEGDFDLEVGGS